MLSCICRNVSDKKIKQCAKDAEGLDCTPQKLVCLYYGKPDCGSCKAHIDEVIAYESVKSTT